MRRIPLKDKSGTTLLKWEDLIRLEADGSSTHFHLRREKQKKITLSNNLKYWLQVLEPYGKLLRIHNSHAVNKHDLYRVEALCVTLRDNTELPLSGTYREAVWQAMDEFNEMLPPAEEAA